MPGIKQRYSEPSLTLLLAGDVMTGRGIDQILPHPGDATLYEKHMRSSMEYVDLAERAHGPIPRSVPFGYIWGDALAEIERRQPDASLINLETAITARGIPESKGINYRMHPANTSVLVAAHVRACTLANNHVLDWGADGLNDTLKSLRAAGIGVAGAGRNLQEASAPLIVRMKGGGRTIIFAFGCPDSGIRAAWKARSSGPGLNVLPSLSPAASREIFDDIRDKKRPGDIVVASIHWGGNWGSDIPDEQRRFAYALVDEALVDIVHGHSSHHPKAIEIYRSKLILYGCGDLINDYEGISGYAQFRSDLVLIYFATVSANRGDLCSLGMAPYRIHKFRLQKASHHEAQWLASTLTRHSTVHGVRVVVTSDNTLLLEGG